MVVESYVVCFQVMDDFYMQECVIDIVDLLDCIFVNILYEVNGQKVIEKVIIEVSILVVDEVLVFMFVEFLKDKFKGIIFICGLNNFYVVILVRVMGVFVVMGCQNVILVLFEDKEILFDGYFGEVIVLFECNIKFEFIQLIEEELVIVEKIDVEVDKFCESVDGCRMLFYINVGFFVEVELNVE